MLKKLLVICGPTATGKTSLAVDLAKKFDGEIISCDSRQVYQGMDIVTGKDLPVNAKAKKYLAPDGKSYLAYFFDQIPVWGLDLVKPDQEFSAAHWVQFSHFVINDIWHRKKMPIIVGGTGFWIKALLQDISTMGVPPDLTMREKIKHYSIKRLVELLAKLDPDRLAKMNQSDIKNPRRLIRAIEIARQKNSLSTHQKNELDIDQKHILQIGLKANLAYMEKRIRQRVAKRLQQGALKEIKGLIEQGYGFELPSMTACGYRVFQDYLRGEQDLSEAVKKWGSSELAYLKRQMVWFKKDPAILWFDIAQKGGRSKVVARLKNWYDRK